MILPSTYGAALALVIVSMLCWGSWANTYKLTGKWRFELYYFDFAIGLIVAALIAAFTFGTLGFDGFSFTDDLLHAGKKQDVYAFAAGVIFNLGNMLLLGAIAECGMATALAVGLGVALAFSSILNFFLAPGSNAALLFAGVAITSVAVALVIVAYRMYKLSRIDELVRTGKLKSTRKLVSSKGVIIAILAGLFIGGHASLIFKAMETDAGLGPYSIGVLFAAGLVGSTFLFNLILMNLPLDGPPVEITEYFNGTLRQHGYGLLGGVVWYLGMVTGLIAATAESTAKLSPGLVTALVQGSLLIALLWGLFYWKEFQESDSRVNSILFIGAALFICGIGLIAVAPTLVRLAG